MNSFASAGLLPNNLAVLAVIELRRRIREDFDEDRFLFDWG